jgi:uncharacterized protein YggE
MRPLLRLPLLAFSLTASSLFASAQTIQINQQNKTIAINTTDEATATADIAAITIGYEIFKPDAESAAAEAGKLSHAIMDALHKAGVEDKSIESKSQSVSRNTNFDEKDSESLRAQRAFHAEQSWEVSAAPKDAATILRVVLASGANQSGTIDWRLSDRKGLQAHAAASALVKARAVAQQMANGLHVKLGDLIYASNQAPTARIYFAVNGMTLNTESASVGSVEPNLAPLEIRPQTIREEATVYAVFAIE